MVRKYSTTEEGIRKRRANELKKYTGNEERRLYLKKWRQSPTGKAMEKRRYQEKYDKNKEKFRAKSAVQRAIKKGLMPRVSELTCDNCGEPAVEYHHESYAKEHQLNVIPLCKQCHRNTY
jgi:formylmethanofuran dehydrogenase subunit E